MDVTLKNFKQVLPEVVKAIDECDFVAIDTELTGLRNGPDTTAYDTPATYYTKLKTGSLDFLLVQVGLCTFRFDAEKDKYIYKAYNFYVFPRTIGRNGNDVNFLCQTSSIHFLCGNGFDFNKLFNEGIPYLNLADAENLQDGLVAKYEYQNQSDSSFKKVAIPDELVSSVEKVCSRIEKFLSANDEKEITFSGCSGFLRKLIHQTVKERFSSDNFSLSTKWIDNNPVLVAQKGKSKADIGKENLERERKEVIEATGFSTIIKHISDSKKLIVGHNMVLDICHIVNRFCWPLPDTYSEFKEMVHALFPRIVDTKHMCNAYPFRDLIPSSVVAHMLKRLQEPPFELKEAEAEHPDFAYSMENTKAHEAGYDAYTTGLAFISLTSYLGRKRNETCNPPSIELLKPFENRVNLMRILDYSYLNFRGEEPTPNRSHVFHISFPKDWKTNDIAQLFNPYGDVHISYINHNSAWVTLHNLEKIEAVIQELVEANLKELPAFRKPYTVMTLRQYYEERTSTSLPNTSNSSHTIARLTAKTSSNPLTSTPGAHSSPSVPQSSGDADPVEVKLPTKRSKVTESVSKKRKKHDQDFQIECMNEDEPSTVDVKSDAPKATRHIDILFNQLKKGDSIEKTFEEPPWE